MIDERHRSLSGFRWGQLSGIDQLLKRFHKNGAGNTDLTQTFVHSLVEHPLAFIGELHKNIVSVSNAFDQPIPFSPIHKFDGAVVPRAKLVREYVDCRRNIVW